MNPNLPGVYLPLLRLDVASNTNLIPLSDYDQGIEAMKPWDRISEVWREQPTLHHIHIFVTLSNRESGPLYK